MHLKSSLYLFLILLSIIFFCSNRVGRAFTTGSGTTTAPGESGQYCGSFGCHFNGAFSPEAKLNLLDTNADTVNSYIPGESYTIIVDVDHDGFPAGYGFQITSLENTFNSASGFFSDLPSRTREVLIGDRQYIEQSNIIDMMPISLNWTAPVSGTGELSFYAAVNLVNGNGSSSGDGADTVKLTIAENLSSSLPGIQHDPNLFYPNPASSSININCSENCTVLRILSMDGRLCDEYAYNNFLDVSALIPGQYILQVVRGDNSYTWNKLLIQ